MKAAVCREFGKPLTIEDIEVESPKRGEVKVRISAAAICHSDIHAINGDFPGELPAIFGHEAAGIVEEIGEGVDRVVQGDRVVVSLLRSCGQCRWCVTGLPHLCDGEFALASENRLHDAGGKPVRAGIATGAFAEIVVVDQSQTVRLPEGMPMDRGALLACGVITGTGAVINTAKVAAGCSVAVIGAGGVGLNAIQGAGLCGGFPIIAIDLLADKLEAARSFGATHIVESTSADQVSEFVRQATDGYGVDYVFATVGNAQAIALGLDLLARRGTLVIVGLPDATAELAVPILPHVLGEKRVIGSLMGSTPLSVDVPKLANLYLNGRLKLDELISERFTLDRINEAISSTEAGHALRNVIVFDGSL